MSALESYTRFLTRHAAAMLLAVAAVTILLGAGITRLRAEFDIEASLPPNHPFIQIDRTIRQQFGGRRTVMIAMVPQNGDVWTPEVLDVVHAVTLDALRLKNIIGQNVVSLAAPAVRYVEERDGRIEVDYLMREPPRTAAEIAALRAKVEADPQLRGILVTPDQRAAMLIVDFYEGELRVELADRVQRLVDPYRSRGIDFFFAGEPILSLTDDEMARSVATRIPIVFLVIAVLLLVSFRNLQGMAIPMLTATLSTIWGLGLMGWTGQVIDSWNVATPILIIAIAAGHSAQMLKRYTEEVERLGDNRAAVVASTVAMGPVMVAAGGVATLGFASLALVGVPALAAFGLSCAYGIASAVVLELTFIPALRTLLPAPRIRVRPGGLVLRFLGMLERAITERRGRRVLIGTAVGVVLAIAGALQIRTYGSTREYMAVGSLPRVHLDELQKHFPGTSTMTVLYEAQPGDATSLALLRHMDGLRAEIERHPLVWRTASLVDLVKILHKTLNPDAPDPYRLPEDQDLTSQLIFLGSSPAFERFTDRSQSKALLVAYLRDDDSAVVGPLVRDARAWVDAHPPPEGARVLIAGGTGPTVLAVNEHTTWSKMLNIAIVLATIYVISSLTLRSPLGGLFVLTPIVASLVALFGLLGWTGVRLDMGSATSLAMAAGIGADYAIYFLYRLREERQRATSDAEALHVALMTSGRAVLFVAASIGGGFAVMGFSKFFGLQVFGTLLPMAMAMSSLAAISLMPVMALRSRPAFIFGNGRETSETAPAAPLVATDRG